MSRYMVLFTAHAGRDGVVEDDMIVVDGGQVDEHEWDDYDEAFLREQARDSVKERGGLSLEELLTDLGMHKES